MELSPRKKAVLSAIVRSYIETGEPIGSKNLMTLLENAPSSATLRNEMSELASLGFLSQPHTSAGRIPTGSAFRLYVKSLMPQSELNDSTKNYITTSFGHLSDPERLPSMAAKSLFELTGLPAFYCNDSGSGAVIKKVEPVVASRRAVMLLCLSSDGRVRNRLCRLNTDVTPQLISNFNTLIRERILRKPLDGMNRAFLQNVVALAGIDSFEMMPLITAVFEMAGQMSTSSVEIMGAPSLYNIFPEESARSIGRMASLGEPFCDILNTASQGSDGVFISEGTPAGVTMIASPIKSGERYCGKIGIMGKGRMSYDQIVPTIEYTASLLGKLMGEALKDMED